MKRRAAIVLPTLDEEARIGALLDQLSRLPHEQVVDIIVADGGSEDGTIAGVQAAATRDARIRLISNPERLQAAGVNRAVAVANAAADTIIRIDAHAVYPDDYVPRILAAFDRTGAEMVATRLVTRGFGCFQRGVAAASNSRAGTGGSLHRMGGRSGFVDHGHHAGIDRAMFARVGGYDRGFAANEDAELDLRVRRAGGRIWFAAEIQVSYFPRTTVRALARQYFRYGQGRAQTYRKHRERLRLRQIIPPVVAAVLVSSLLLAPLIPELILLPITYLACVAAETLRLFSREPSRCTLAAAPALATMHLAWGCGFIGTLLRKSVREGRSVSATDQV